MATISLTNWNYSIGDRSFFIGVLVAAETDLSFIHIYSANTVTQTTMEDRIQIYSGHVQEREGSESEQSYVSLADGHHNGSTFDYALPPDISRLYGEIHRYVDEAASAVRYLPWIKLREIRRQNHVIFERLSGLEREVSTHKQPALSGSVPCSDYSHSEEGEILTLRSKAPQHN